MKEVKHLSLCLESENLTENDPSVSNIVNVDLQIEREVDISTYKLNLITFWLKFTINCKLCTFECTDTFLYFRTGFDISKPVEITQQYLLRSTTFAHLKIF